MKENPDRKKKKKSIYSLKKLVYSEYVYGENCNEKRYEFIHTLLMLLV